DRSSSGFVCMLHFRLILDISWHAVVRVLVGTANEIAGLSRLMRGQMVEVLGQEYRRTARAKGLAERVVLYKHAFRNAVIPFVATLGGLLPSLISGAGFVEEVMAWPGITHSFLDDIANQDLSVIASFLSVRLVLLMIGYLMSDLLLPWVAPRNRYE
ncbi:ABC transporter permease subunit, partial [Thermus scotoductus]|uniref:ABC transporter permease subunit n=1 Tax=Thermus scotoductus TaxID=37636 RepID=UPI00100165CF